MAVLGTRESQSWRLAKAVSHVSPVGTFAPSSIAVRKALVQSHPLDICHFCVNWSLPRVGPELRQVHPDTDVLGTEGQMSLRHDNNQG